VRALAIAAPLVVAGCFGVAGPQLARRLPPRHATWLLSAGGAVIAVSALALLAVLAFVLIGQLPGVADEGHWSASILREHAPAEPGVSGVALVFLVAAVASAIVAAARRGLALIAAYRSCRSLPDAGNLVVVDEAPAGAVAIPGRPGRILVARSLLSALSATERRALLAHERSHLRHGHHWHLTVVSVAAAANPLLAPLRGAVSLASERWADEEAAAEVGDRRTVAAAVARAAFVSRRSSDAVMPGLAAGSHAVPQRVAALLIQPPSQRPALMLLALGVVLLGAVGAVVAGKEVEHLFEFAGRAYRAAHG
jgi:Zn-dependent protease with chaperone function